MLQHTQKENPAAGSGYGKVGLDASSQIDKGGADGQGHRIVNIRKMNEVRKAVEENKQARRENQTGTKRKTSRGREWAKETGAKGN